MITISLCMIVKNEEALLSRCLESVYSAVDEIIIVDTGSTDRTREIALQFTDKVYGFEWVDDFSLARNFSFSKASMDYQMWLDADDVLPPAEREKLIALKSTLPTDTDVVAMLYHVAFDSSGEPVLTARRERLFRRSANFLWNDPVHEYITMCGKIIHSDIAVHHKKEGQANPLRNINIYEKRIERGETLSPRSRYYYARELMDHRRYNDAIRSFNAFLSEGKGWVEDNIAACLCVGRCYLALKDEERAAKAFLNSFYYDLPRAEGCCELGYSYQRKFDYARAAYWFETALNAPRERGDGFSRPDCYGYIPHIELCVCSFHLGDFERAVYHNEQAGALRPHDLAVVRNREFFSTLKQ